MAISVVCDLWEQLYNMNFCENWQKLSRKSFNIWSKFTEMMFWVLRSVMDDIDDTLRNQGSGGWKPSSECQKIFNFQ